MSDGTRTAYAQLHVMPGIAFVDGQDLQHVTVVFLQKTLHLLRRPVRRRRADGVIAVGVGIQRRRVVQIRQRVAAAEFRHHDHLAFDPGPAV